MATYRQTINRILTTLSEDAVGSSVAELVDSYHILVGTFVNQIKEEIEDAHNWRVLRTVYIPTILGGTNRIEIVGSNERSRLVREHDAHFGRLRALVFDVTSGDEVELIEKPLDFVERRILMDNGGGNPEIFAIDTTATGVPELVVYPQPVTDKDVSITMVTPQDRLEPSDLDVNIAIPNRPLEIGGIWYALEERGEELGVNALFTEKKFIKALDDAISRDAAEQGGYELVPV